MDFESVIVSSNLTTPAKYKKDKKMTPEFREKFLEDRDHTGRFIVTSKRTGKSYYVEAIGDPRSTWGSIDPATGNLMNKKGAGKYKGSVEKDESLITEDNGFIKIHDLKPGISPHAYIEMLDADYPDKVVN